MESKNDTKEYWKEKAEQYKTNLANLEASVKKTVAAVKTNKDKSNEVRNKLFAPCIFSKKPVTI